MLPARNATMGEFVSVLQRAILDRPVVDKTRDSADDTISIWSGRPTKPNSAEKFRRLPPMLPARRFLRQSSSSLG